MAEELGSAVLRLTIDDSDIRTGLERTQKLVNQASGRIQAQLNRTVSAASGSNFGAQERAYKAALNVSKELLGTDLRRYQLLRQFQQQLARTTAARAVSAESGFAAFSAAAPGAPRRARNEERRAQQDERRTAQLDALDADLARVRERRLAAEQRALQLRRESEASLLQAEKKRLADRGARANVVSRRATEAISSGLIGGAFPLLFGQGIGAAVGGGAGGVAGGALGGGFGFGLSLVGTALGSAFDEAINKVKALAAGLDDPIGKFDELRQAALFSSSATERQIKALIDQGREAEAAARIQLDLLRTYGDTSELDGLKSAYDELGRAFNQLSVVTAKFVAGPLADFLNKLGGSFSAQAAKGLLDERVAALGIGEQERKALITQSRTNLAEQLPGKTGAEKLLLIYDEANRLLDKQYGKREDIAAAERKLAEVSSRQARIDQLRLDLSDAQVAGKERQALQIRQEIADLQRLQDISRSAPEDLSTVTRSADEEKLRLATELLRLDRERLASAITLSAENEAIAGALGLQIQGAQKLLGVQGDATRQALAQRQALLEAAQAARGGLGVARAEYDAARLRGDDLAAEAALAKQQQVAQELRLALTQGADALTEAGRKLRENLTAAISDFTAIREDPGGLNRFLNPEQRNIRAQQNFQLLLPQFRQAQAEFFNLTGQQAPEFRGPTEGVNAAIRDFISAVERERTGGKNVVDIQAAIATTNKTLADVNGALALQIGALVNKDWSVNVEVAADGSSKAFGDLLPGAIS